MLASNGATFGIMLAFNKGVTWTWVVFVDVLLVVRRCRLTRQVDPVLKAIGLNFLKVQCF